MSEYLTPADLLAHGLRLAPLAEPPVECPPGTHCALTGQPITRGYPRNTMTTDATAEFLDHFGVNLHGYVSEAAARCYRNASPRKGNPTARSVLTFEDGDCWNPLINRESAIEQGRECWSTLVRSVWPTRAGERCLAILTTDQKKRLWPRARVGALGPRTPVYLYDSKYALNGVHLIDWPALIECLELIEEVYSRGFSKEQIRVSLYSATKAMQALGVAWTRFYERELSQWRNRVEFLAALLIAQKYELPEEAEEENNHGDSPSIRAHPCGPQLTLL